LPGKLSAISVHRRLSGWSEGRRREGATLRLQFEAHQKTTAGLGPAVRKALSRTSERIVHVELDGMRRHLEARDLRHLELDIGLDEIVVEDATRLQEPIVLAK